MTPRQRLAFLSPCHRAHETSTNRYQLTLHWKDRTWSTILTVNA